MVVNDCKADARFIQEQEIVPRTSGLNEVTKIIEIHQKKRKENIKYFDIVWNRIKRELEKDVVFKELQDGCDFVGNYGDGIKINKSDEYDFHFYLYLPYSEKLKVTKGVPGAVDLNIRELLVGQTTSSPIHQKLKEMSDGEHFLMPGKINAWVQRLINTYITKTYCFEEDGNTFKLVYSKHGSAQLFDITVNKNIKFAVNIYPGIKLQTKQHWISERKADDSTFWAAVTKKQKDAPRSFHCSYEKIERNMLSSANQLRNALKLLMKIRDKDQLTPFKTHYLKSVCLKMVNEVNWAKMDTKMALVTIFKEVLKCCKNDNVPCYWDSNQNLIEHLVKKRFKYRLIEGLEMALPKVENDEIPWAFCNKNERLFYYGIPKKLSYRRGHRRHFAFNNLNQPIPKEIQDEGVIEMYLPLYLK